VRDYKGRELVDSVLKLVEARPLHCRSSGASRSSATAS
jgi:hypothetical protein